MGIVRISQGIRIEVEVEYWPARSIVSKGIYAFRYWIGICNRRREDVRLLGRRWIVESRPGVCFEVKGAGVVGMQPVIERGGCFHYGSWVHIQSPIGIMRGAYLLEVLDAPVRFEAAVPTFLLVYSPLFN